MNDALPPGTGGVIAIYDSEGAGAVDKALLNAVKKSVAQIDGVSAKELKAGWPRRKPEWEADDRSDQIGQLEP
jgi:hypothetical protein